MGGFSLIKDIYNIIPISRIKKDECMKNHTSFKIGGPVDYMLFPETEEEIAQALYFCNSNSIPVFVFGLGSNILVSDKGIRGMVIKIGNQLNKVRVAGEIVYADSGIRLSELSRKIGVLGLSGLEFAEGIPGSLGGAVSMNAGAYGGQISDLIIQVEAISPEGIKKVFSKEELDFGYRKSVFQKNNYIITSVCLSLKNSDTDAIKAKIKEYRTQRKEKQPLEYPSAGSVFKRPEGYYVGAIIEELGLKGFRIGGAAVSEKHAGFIVNLSCATADDVLKLINHIKEEVNKKYNVLLETEVKFVGEE